MRPERTKKSTIPEISVTGFWNVNDLKYGRNQYHTPSPLMKVQTTDGPKPQYQPESATATQAVI
jgi:hypothetical protein